MRDPLPAKCAIYGGLVAWHSLLPCSPSSHTAAGKIHPMASCLARLKSSRSAALASRALRRHHAQRPWPRAFRLTSSPLGGLGFPLGFIAPGGCSFAGFSLIALGGGNNATGPRSRSGGRIGTSRAMHYGQRALRLLVVDAGRSRIARAPSARALKFDAPYFAIVVEFDVAARGTLLGDSWGVVHMYPLPACCRAATAVASSSRRWRVLERTPSSSRRRGNE